MFVSVDGPSGIGVSTTVRALGELLRTRGVPMHLTSEPSETDIGVLASARVDVETSGPALACLFAADRYQRLQVEIRPRLAAGEVVVSDRYVPTGLVTQRLDDVELDFLQAINALADPPDLAVILTADPAKIAERLQRSGVRNRYHRRPDISARENILYKDASEAFASAGVQVLRLETSHYPPDILASMICTRIEALRARRDAPGESGRTPLMSGP
ncbi:dTMP kinase [Kibdelosporangium aridum]|uniref:Thymidylate kinase n=1 Tax=Kibdelosporangium aridum TaxID=2030 RepID=A0A428Z436_KIBAR|nr:dTMP kinase [Kibdelosporangium aridum]